MVTWGREWLPQHHIRFREDTGLIVNPVAKSLDKKIIFMLLVDSSRKSLVFEAFIGDEACNKNEKKLWIYEGLEKPDSNGFLFCKFLQSLVERYTTHMRIASFMTEWWGFSSNKSRQSDTAWERIQKHIFFFKCVKKERMARAWLDLGWFKLEEMEISAFIVISVQKSVI